MDTGPYEVAFVACGIALVVVLFSILARRARSEQGLGRGPQWAVLAALVAGDLWVAQWIVDTIAGDFTGGLLVTIVTLKGSILAFLLVVTVRVIQVLQHPAKYLLR